MNSKSKAILLGILVLFATAMLAQDITGTIVGTVKDQSGAIVPKATVTITNTDTEIVARTLTSNENGEYSVPSLAIGHYSVSAEASGFKKATVSAIQLHVNEKLTIDPRLQVGNSSESVDVEASALQIELQSATASGLITGTQVRELALNNRNYEQLVSLMPGVSYGGDDQLYIGTTNPNSGQSNQVRFAINGGRKSMNNWTVDGADNVDRGANLTLLTYPSVDAIAEFKVLRGLYSAEAGRGGAGQISVVTRSGTKSFHGGAYEFFRNNVLNANNYFNKPNPTSATTFTGVPRPVLRYNDFGYNVGGPIFIPNAYNTAKNKTFFFFSQEYRRVITNTNPILTFPTAGELAGNFGATLVCPKFTTPTGNTCAAPLTNQIPSVNFDSTAVAYVKDIFSKLPNAPTNVAALRAIPVTERNVFNARQEIIKVDHVFGPKVSAFVRYEHDAIPTEEPTGLFQAAATNLPLVNTTDSNSPGYSWVAKGTLTLSPTLLAEVGYNYSYGAITNVEIGLNSKANSPDINPTLPFPTTLGRIPNISLSGGTGFSGFGPYADFNRNHNVNGSVTKIWNQHTFKLGATYNKYNKSENSAGNNVGTFNFDTSGQPVAASTYESTWANFLLGRSSSFSQDSQDLVADIHQNQIEAFVQDDWRVRSNLTLNLGVRYSYFGQPYDGAHEISNFDPALYVMANAPQLVQSGASAGTIVSGTQNNTSGIITGGVNSPFGNQVANTPKNNFGPRIGLAWDPYGNGKTSIRSGFGVFFDSIAVSQYEVTIFSNPPFINSPSTPATIFSNPGGAGFNISLTPKRLIAVPLGGKTPNTSMWSLDVQHEFTKNLVFDIGYYGSKGTHLYGGIDINQVPLGAAQAAGLITPTTILNASKNSNYAPFNLVRPFPGYGAINQRDTIFGSKYNSLQTSLQKRFKGNSLIGLNYTWSHGLTDSQTDSTTAQNTYNLRGDYGPLEFDRTHVFTANYVYELPFFQNQKTLLGYTLGGWQLSGIVTANSGIPLTITTSSFDSGFQGILGSSASGPRPNLIGNPNTGAHTVLQWFNTTAFSPNPNPKIGTGIPGTSGRGAVRGPGYQKWDVTLAKNIPITESVKFQFRAEAYNVFNHTNFNAVSTNVISGNFGQITSARDPRIMQLGLKMYF